MKCVNCGEEIGRKRNCPSCGYKNIKKKSPKKIQKEDLSKYQVSEEQFYDAFDFTNKDNLDVLSVYKIETQNLENLELKQCGNVSF